MAPIQSLKLYEDSRIRALWNEDEEEWYFSVVDVVAVLTEAKTVENTGTSSSSGFGRKAVKR